MTLALIVFLSKWCPYTHQGYDLVGKNMSYAGARRIIDVDSHLFELDDFLHSVATDEEATFIKPMQAQTELPVSLDAIDRGREHFDRRNADPEVMT